MSLNIDSPIVSVEWLNRHLLDDNLIVLDATIPKVTANNNSLEEKEQIKGAVFFDIKKEFSNQKSPFPNTVLPALEFEQKAQELGINNNSLIIVYDDLGIYSSARVWWLFQLMGFKNIAVLDGGLPEWKSKRFSIESSKNNKKGKGNFKSNFKPEKLKLTNDVLSSIEDKSILVVDARSRGRFNATDPEPRKDLKGGRIPNSINLPFNEVLEDGKIKSKDKLKEIFNRIEVNKKELIFSCGSGITASILALAAEISNKQKHSVYDGSWTEWASTEGLVIEK